MTAQLLELPKVEGFAVGSIVRLKSGGPMLTVVEVEAEAITCAWFSDINGSQLLSAGKFPPAALTRGDH